jgi:predicted nucleic acid-binding protein
MSYFYVDSSALVKRYVSEMGSAWIAALTDPSTGNTVVVAEITRVECAAAIAARHRASGGISLAERNALVNLLLSHFDTEYEITPLNNVVISQAVNLTQRHRLRGYDAVQLAAALDAHATAISAGLLGLTFIAADDDLVAAAQAEGLTADNPNAHP